jgi:two-component system chemotaxis response regulator CheY
MISVLVVDDEPFIHQLYRDILEFHGYSIAGEAYDGDEAVKVFIELERKPDIIIMDHRMPNKDGVDSTREILSIDPKARIVFASADSTVRGRALEMGASEFLAKPFQMKDLLDSLRRLS